MQMMRASILFCIIGVAFSSNPQPLPSLRINSSTLSVSGISAGGAFAIQVHVAFSSKVKAVASIAGPPYFCAEGEVGIALSSCMSEPLGIIPALLVDKAKQLSGEGKIDDVSNMATSRVYQYTGTKDTVVLSGVVRKSEEFYSHFVPSERNYLENTIPSEHSWVSNNYGNACDFLGEPYMNNCSYDATGTFMKQFFPHINAPGEYNPANLYEFDQSQYTPAEPAVISLAKTGYVYIPEQCRTNKSVCHLHFSFHGCEMYANKIGTKFVVHTGLNEYAETNDLVIIYPQTIASELEPYNPKGCFDWWGYTDELLDFASYATKNGRQMITVANMVSAISGGVL